MKTDLNQLVAKATFRIFVSSSMKCTHTHIKKKIYQIKLTACHSFINAFI